MAHPTQPNGDLALDANPDKPAVLQGDSALVHTTGENAASARMRNPEVLLHDGRGAADLVPDDWPPLCFGQHLVDGLLNVIALSHSSWLRQGWERFQRRSRTPGRDNGLSRCKSPVHQ